MHPGYFPVFFWSLLILFSFWGYGELLRRRINRPEFADIGWGLTCAWGMSVVLALGGLLMAFHLANAANLTLVVLFGAAAAVYYLAGKITTKDTKNTKGNSAKPKYKIQNTKFPSRAEYFTSSMVAWWNSALFAVIVLLAVLAFASSIAWPFQIDPNDDLTGYLVYPQQILQSGTLIEPFSFQRAATFGGQALAQALVMVAGGERNGHVPDRGFAMLILTAIFLKQLSSTTGWRRTLGLLVVFIFLISPVPRISTHGAMLGGCFLTAALYTFERIPLRTTSLGLVLPVSLLGFAAASIRRTFLLLFGLWLVGCLAFIFVAQFGEKGLRQEISLVFKIVALFGVFMIPFSVLLYKSNGTPLLPPFNGFVSSDYQIHSYQNLGQDISAIASFIATPSALAVAALSLLALIFSSSFLHRTIICSALITVTLTLYTFSAQAYIDKCRYTYPLIVPIVFYVLCKAISVISSLKAKDSIAARFEVFSVMLIPALGFWVLSTGNQTLTELRAQVLTLPAQIAETSGFFTPAVQKSYSTLQARVPRGEPILTIIDGSYLMDFSRNPVYSINVIGASAPPPGIPFGKGPDALRLYLLSQGIRYVICVDFDNAVLLYTRRLWTTDTRPERFYQLTWKPRFSDFMSNMDALGGVNK